MPDSYDANYQTPEQLLAALGERIQRLRLQRELTQKTLADKAGISERALRVLEAGQGSSLSTFVRVMKAMGLADLLDAIAPEPTVSPMALLRAQRKERQRGSR